MLVKAMTILEPETIYMNQCGRSAVDDKADHHEGLTMMLERDLTTFIDAPMIDELRIEVDDPMATFNMQFWPMVKALTISNEQMHNDAALHLHADALDSLAHLTNLTLLGRVQWVDNQIPLSKK
ncbi:hypothetical protein GGF32_006593 [Allomyces javanicus]|nr:hypothetical protein GGF32_006593 [Allomyces javanicus]